MGRSRKPEVVLTDDEGNVLSDEILAKTPERWRGWELGELVWAPSKNTRKLGEIRRFILTSEKKPRERAFCFFDHDGERYEQFHDIDTLRKL
jgi:hypothetical protein